MLLSLPDHIRDCYQRAADCRERADRLADGDLKDFYLAMEQRWLMLARSYEYVERLDSFLPGKDRPQKTPIEPGKT